MFKNLELYGWRQIEYVKIEFHPRLTVLTGANGAGKTTILNIINKHYGWSIEFISAPKGGDYSGKRKGALELFTGIFRTLLRKERPIEPEDIEPAVGSIAYLDTDKIATIRVPRKVTNTYHPTIENGEQVIGLHIPSHRPVYSYQPVKAIPTQPKTSIEAFDNYSKEVRSRYVGKSSGIKANYFIKENLLALAMYGYGNQVISANTEARDIFEGFQEILKIVLPPKLGFDRITIDIPEIILVTKSGDFPLDAVSGGVASIIDMAWQIYMFSKAHGDKFVITIDEPENHLHPELQQTLLPSFLEAFPETQFIIATHNPLIIGSVPESNIYALRFNERSKVESIRLETADKTGSSNEILREILGLPFTMPIWVNDRLTTIIQGYSNSPPNEETFNRLRDELNREGLEKYTANAIVKVVEANDQTQQTT